MKFSGEIFSKQMALQGTKCAPLLADLFLHGYKAEFIKGLFKASKKHLALKLSFTFMHIDAVLSLHNSKISDNIDLISN